MSLKYSLYFFKLPVLKNRAKVPYDSIHTPTGVEKYTGVNREALI